MKIKSILAISALTLGLTGLANAATTNYVYMTGSSAFRPCIFNTFTNQTPLVKIFDAAPAVVVGKCSTVGTLDPHTGGQMMFHGDIGGAHYVIKCSWSGSEAGISDVTQASGAGKLSFINDDQTGITTATLTATDSHNVDIAMADNEQSVSLVRTPALTGVSVGIVPFIWVKNAQTNSAVTTAPADWNRLVNVTDPMLRVALTGGAPLALFTGNGADTKMVYVAGRDNLSGTFVNTMLCTQFGLSVDPSQIKIQKIGTGQIATMTSSNLLTGKGAGIEGEASGGTLSGNLVFIGSSTNLDWVASKSAGANVYGWYAIAYLGLVDADIALGIQSPIALPNGKAVGLSYNGVAETPDNIINGTYSFWGNEYIYQSAHNFGVSGNATTVYNKLVSSIPSNCDGVYFFATTAMTATKSGAAADPTQ